VTDFTEWLLATRDPLAYRLREMLTDAQRSVVGWPEKQMRWMDRNLRTRLGKERMALLVAELWELWARTNKHPDAERYRLLLEIERAKANLWMYDCRRRMQAN
jgi:hypothetical protein